MTQPALKLTPKPDLRALLDLVIEVGRIHDEILSLIREVRRGEAHA